MQGTTGNGVPCFVSGENCNKAQNEDLKRKDFRHISATQTILKSARASNDIAPSAVEIPADLQNLLNAWPTLPEHIRAAIIALVGTVKP